MLTVTSYNSAVFSSISAYGYSAFTVSPSFVSGPYTDLRLAINASFRDALGLSSSYVGTNSPELLFIELQNIYDLIHNNSVEIEMLEKQDCITAYAQNFVSNRASLVMPAVFFNQSENLTILGYDSSSEVTNSVDPFGWICSQQGYFYSDSDSSDLLGPCRDRLDGIRFNSSGWMPDGYEIEECYSQRVDEHCKVQFSLHLAVVVILFNAHKAGIMFYMALRLQGEPLMTIGDAVSSFLQREDPSSRAMCLASKKLITSKNFNHDPDVPLKLEFSTKSRRWYISASVKRWVTCITMFLLALILVSALFAYGISELVGPKNATAISKLGLVEINTYAINPFNWELEESVTGAGLLITNVILANMAQPVLSFLYFTYNGLCTCMFLAQEWNSYSRERKGLRVLGVPVGAQRGTYFLQLPYRYGMPLVGLSALLHWLVSQSIFLVRVDEIYLPDSANPSQSDGEPTFTSCGYSPFAIIFVITVWGLMVLAILGLGARRYRGGMPVVGSCSLGMAAACHRGGKDADGWKREVRWGLDGEAHCVFSTESVELPVEGKLYS